MSLARGATESDSSLRLNGDHPGRVRIAGRRHEFQLGADRQQLGVTQQVLIPGVQIVRTRRVAEVALGDPSERVAVR